MILVLLHLNIMLMKEVRVPHLDKQGHKQLFFTHLCSFSNNLLKIHLHTHTHLQQGHTYSNKTTPAYSATPCGCHFLSNHQNDQSICGEKFGGIDRTFLELVNNSTKSEKKGQSRSHGRNSTHSCTPAMHREA